MPERDPETGRFIPADGEEQEKKPNPNMPSWVSGFAQQARAIPSTMQRLAVGMANAGRGILGALGGLVRTILTVGIGALGAALATLVGVVGGLVAAIRMSVNTAKEWGRSLALLRANTGLSFTQGFGVASRFGLFGVKPDELAGMAGNNPLALQLRGGLLGDPERIAREYQARAAQGPLGRQYANSMLDYQFGGQASDQVRLLANMRPDTIREQLAFGAKFDRSLGLDPELLREYSERVSLLQNRIGYMVERLQLVFAVKLLPAVERGLSGVANFIANNADKIVDVLTRVAQFLVADFPPMLLRFGAGVAAGLANFLEGTSLFLQGLAGQVPAILGVLDAILNGIRTFVREAAGLAAAAAQGAHNLINSPLGQTVQQVAGANPLGTVAAVAGTAAALKLGGGAAAKVGSRAGGSLLGALWRGAGGWVSGAARAAGGIASNAGSLAQYAGRFGLVGLAGGALGVAGYEGLRQLPVGPWRNLPSTYQIYQYYNNGVPVQGAPPAVSGAAMNPAQQAQALMQQKGALSPYLPQDGRTMTDARLQALAAFDSQIGTSNLAGNQSLNANLQGMLRAAGNGLSGGAEPLRALSANLEERAAGWDEGTKKIFEDISRGVNQTEKNTREQAKHAQSLLDTLPAMTRDLVSRVKTNLVEDAALAVLR